MRRGRVKGTVVRQTIKRNENSMPFHKVTSYFFQGCSSLLSPLCGPCECGKLLQVLKQLINVGSDWRQFTRVRLFH